MSLNFLQSLTLETQVFIGLITVLAIFFHVRFTPRHASIGPTVLTTAGIFGCFVGIALGLRTFSPEDVAGSVPKLIDGIKTAFWVSIFGIGWALTLKLRVLARGEPKQSESERSEGATIDDLADLLRQLNRSLAGSEDSALISQTKLLRQDTNDRLDKLRASLDHFADKVADANSEALIRALEEVIRDFNAKINEQFGENFRHLNEAVEKLVTWQAQYKDQLTELIVAETATRKTMTEASLRYADLVGKANVFVNVATQLDRLLNALEAQRTALDGGLKELATLVVKAADGLPQMDRQITEMVRQVAEGVRTSNEQVAATIKAAAQANATSNVELRQAVSETIKKTHQDLSGHVKQLSEDTKKQVVALDAGMEKALTQSLESLGRQLTALSSKFVEDYAPLTDRLREVVQMASRV